MSMSGIVQGVAGNAIWSSVLVAARRIAGRQIQITYPRPLETLSDPEPLGEGFSFPVRGTLKHLAKNHQIWLLTEDELTGHVLPQGFSIVLFDPRQRTWVGRINGTRRRRVKIIAVVAPPTSQDLFRYFQNVGRHRGYVFEPLQRIPAECTNMTSVQALLPEVPGDAVEPEGTPPHAEGQNQLRATANWAEVTDAGYKRSPLEAVAFENLKNAFERLPLAQKIALRRICENGTIHELTLSGELEQQGFGEKHDILRRIIGALNCTDFVELKNDGMLVPNSSRLRDIGEIVSEWRC